MLQNSIYEIIAAASLSIIAYASFFIGYLAYQGRRQERRSRSFDIILTSDPLPIFDAQEINEPGFAFETNQDEFRRLMRDLNRLEAISIGVREGFYDEHILREYMGSSFVRTYGSTREIIDRLRRDRDAPKLFVNFEAMARRWS